MGVFYTMVATDVPPIIPYAATHDTCRHEPDRIRKPNTVLRLNIISVVVRLCPGNM